MAKYKKDSGAKQVMDSALDDEDDGIGCSNNSSNGRLVDEKKLKCQDDLSIIVTILPLNGRPFSAVSREILTEYFDQPEELFDEFGFRRIEGEENSDPTAELPPIETSSNRMRWLAYIQSTHEQVEEDLVWGKVNINKVRNSSKFMEMLDQNGIPHSLRPFLWPRLSGALEKRNKCGCSYMDIVQKSSQETTTVDLQIEKDLLRTLPNNYCFSRAESLGVHAMHRILKAVAFLYPDLGYCQGMGMVVSSLLLVCTEENVFWMMCSLVEDILPPNYYSHSLLGLRADERVVKHLMQIHMPELTELVEEKQMDMTLITVNWLLTLLASAFPPRLLYRLWDLLFSTGSATVFRIVVSMLKINEERLLEQRHTMSPTDLFTAMAQIPSTVTDLEHLLETMRSFEYSVTDHLIDELRKKHQGLLMVDSGMIQSAENGNLPKQKTNRRKLTRSKSIIQHFFQGSKEDAGWADDPRMKNIRQTELVVDLRNAISQICKHFQECEEKHERTIATQADYSISDRMDRELFMECRREGRRRARALMDFEKKDEDDLGFRRNDLIVVLSERDEHCWVGELDGHRGWFPAKFVELIDERGKNYCIRGDEVVNFRVTELVRGPLAMAFRQLLFHGLRQSSRISVSTFVSHPWPFIEQIASSLVDNQQSATNSRLTLCATFRLDQDGKVLSPEELLFRAVQTINRSHNLVNAQMDVKLRSLVVFALNEQCLHLWFDILCHCRGQDPARKRFYHSWSFIRSPASQQIKSELRLLSQFTFNLNVNLEVGGDGPDKDKSSKSSKPSANGLAAMNGKANSKLLTKGKQAPQTKAKITTDRQPLLKEDVRDMLIKHNLFSWDL